MGKKTFIILIGLMFFSPALGKVQVTIYGDNSYPPYSYEDNQAPKGIYSLIVKTAFSRMTAYDITIKAIPWKRGLRMLKNGTAFALYPPYARQPQRPYMDYSIPILEEKLMVFVNGKILKKRRLEKWPDDFIGLKIGKNAGFIISQDIGFKTLVSSGHIIVQEANDNRMNLLKLRMGRIDAYVNDRISILWELQRLKTGGEFEKKNRYLNIFEGPTISVEYGHLGFTNRQGSRYPFKQDFTTRFNQEIRQMKENGEIKRIVSRFLGK